MGDKAMLLLRKKINVAGMRVHENHLRSMFVDVPHLFHSSGSRDIEQDSETMRLQVLGDPALMRQLEHVSHYCTRHSASLQLTVPLHRPNQNWQTLRVLTPPDSPNCCASSARCKRTLSSNVNERWTDSNLTLSISKPNERSKRRSGSRPCSRIWNMPWSTAPKHSGGSLCSSRCLSFPGCLARPP